MSATDELSAQALLQQDALYDLLLAVFDECSQPALKKEKAISDFVTRCMYFAS
jgi:hypothetical protein